MPHKIRITHVIFDVDGTVFETRSISKKVYQNIAHRFGKQLPADFNSMLIGKSEDEANATFVKKLNLPISSEECKKLKRKLEREPLLKVNLRPGVEKLVSHLRKHNIPIAMASSNDYSLLDLKLNSHRTFRRCFSHTLTASERFAVKRPKPAPDIFIVCASRFRNIPEAKHCLVIEDDPYGVEAAISAGMHVVMVPDENLDRENTTMATLVLESLADFKPEQFGLPPYPK